MLLIQWRARMPCHAYTCTLHMHYAVVQLTPLICLQGKGAAYAGGCDEPLLRTRRFACMM